MTRTNAYSLLCMIIRAVAVWATARLAIGLPGLVMALQGSSQPALAAGVVLGGAIVSLALLAALWLFADKLAKLALVRTQEIVFDSSVEPKTWLGIALAAMGAWFVVNVPIDAAYIATRYAAASGQPYVEEDTVFSLVLPDIIASTLQLVIGGLLILRGQGLSRWIHRLRYGVEPAPVEPAA